MIISKSAISIIDVAEAMSLLAAFLCFSLVVHAIQTQTCGEHVRLLGRYSINMSEYSGGNGLPDLL